MAQSKVLQDNATRCGFIPCDICKTYEPIVWGDNYKEIFPKVCTKKHNIINSPDRYTHFLIQGKWYFVSAKYTLELAALVPIDMALCIQGALCSPNPVKIKNLTDLFTLIRCCGVTPEQMMEVFPPEQVRRMTGRVFKKLVKGK